MNIRIPWRTWTGRYSSNISSEKYPISRVCATCGSESYRTIGESITDTIGKDRECLHSGTRYAPTPSRTSALLFLVLGLIIAIPFTLAAGDNLLALLHLHPDKTFHPDIWSALCPAMIALVGVWFIRQSLTALKRRPHAGSHKQQKMPS